MAQMSSIPRRVQPEWRACEAQAFKIEHVDLELIGPAEDVTSEMRHEHQADIDSDDVSAEALIVLLSNGRCCERCSPQDKSRGTQERQEPTQKLNPQRPAVATAVKILRVQTGSCRGSNAECEQARNHRGGQCRAAMAVRSHLAQLYHRTLPTAAVGSVNGLRR